MIAFLVICMSCGNREGISGSPCSTLKMCRCSVLYSIIIYIYIYIVMSHFQSCVCCLSGRAQPRRMRAATRERMLRKREKYLRKRPELSEPPSPAPLPSIPPPPEPPSLPSLPPKPPAIGQLLDVPRRPRPVVAGASGGLDRQLASHSLYLISKSQQQQQQQTKQLDYNCTDGKFSINDT